MKMPIPLPCDGSAIFFPLLPTIPIKQIINDEDVSGIRSVD